MEKSTFDTHNQGDIVWKKRNLRIRVESREYITE